MAFVLPLYSVIRMKKVLSALFLIGGALTLAFARKGTEAAQPVISTVTFSGNAGTSSAELSRRITLHPGGVLSEEQLRFSQGVVESVFRDKGFYEASVSTAVVILPENQAAVRFEIHPGPVFHIGDIRVEGNRAISRV